ncbi:hypothetical protein [Inquilinus sp.]|jgi:hypothetical protein
MGIEKPLLATVEEIIAAVDWTLWAQPQNNSSRQIEHALLKVAEA